MKEDQRQFMSLVARPPARLNVEQVAWMLNCQEHDIPTLVAAKLLKPLGNPSPNGTKYFATADVLAVLEDRAWLNRATATIQQYWVRKNQRRTPSDDLVLLEDDVHPQGIWRSVSGMKAESIQQSFAIGPKLRRIGESEGSRTISFRLSRETITSLEERAARLGVSPGELARQYVENELRQGEERADLQAIAGTLFELITKTRNDVAIATDALLKASGHVDETEAEAWVKANLEFPCFPSQTP